MAPVNPLLAAVDKFADYLEEREQSPKASDFIAVNDARGPLRVGDSFPLDERRMRRIKDQFSWDPNANSWRHRKSQTPLVTKRDIYATILGIMRRQGARGMTTTEKAIRGHYHIRVVDCRKALSIWQELHLDKVDPRDDAAWADAIAYSRRIEDEKARKSVRNEATGIADSNGDQMARLCNLNERGEEMPDLKQFDSVGQLRPPHEVVSAENKQDTGCMEDLGSSTSCLPIGIKAEVPEGDDIGLFNGDEAEKVVSGTLNDDGDIWLHGLERAGTPEGVDIGLLDSDEEEKVVSGTLNDDGDIWLHGLERAGTPEGVDIGLLDSDEEQKGVDETKRDAQSQQSSFGVSMSNNGKQILWVNSRKIRSC